MSTLTDSWDQIPSSSLATGLSSNTVPRKSNPPIPQASVKDDWEDDDDEDDEEVQPPTEEKNKQIWEDANTKPQHPMPDVIIARSASVATPSTHLPPQGVFQQQPAMHILKRPSNSQSNSSNSINSNSGESPNESLKEREARYHAARERIFGNASVASDGSKTPLPPVSNNGSTEKVVTIPAVKVLREPRGPNDTKNSDRPGTSKGFGNRKPKPSVSSGNGNRSNLIETSS